MVSNRIFVFFLIAMFFGPYFPGTPFRVDQIIGWAYICAFGMYFVKGVRFGSATEKKIMTLSLIILIIAFCRIWIDFTHFRFSFQFTNQYSYFAVGACIYYFHKKRLRSGREMFVRGLLCASIIINAYAMVQSSSPGSPYVQTVADWYGGDKKIEGGLEAFGSISHLVIAAGRVTSIFNIIQAYAIFNLIIIALALGARRDINLARKDKILALAALIFAIVGGVLSVSKVFILGGGIMFLILGIFLMSNKAIKELALILLTGFLFGAVFVYVAEQNRVLSGILDLVVSGDIMRVFLSRFGGGGEVGYLDESMAITFELQTLLYGLGVFAGEHHYSDFGYRQILILGGLPLFILFYGLVIYILMLNWRNRKISPYAMTFFALGVALLAAEIGIACHIQGRVIPIWMLLNLVVCFPRDLLPRGIKEFEQVHSGEHTIQLGDKSA